MAEQKHHATNLQASAQLVTILGRELIDENAVGLLELVKNAYDADATEVDVHLANLHEPNKTQIIVHDNGFGMDIEDVLTRWMIAGYSKKADEKRAALRTPKGRLPLGQMGIGRFATARMGQVLKVISKKAGCPEIYFEIPWAAYAGEVAMSDVEIDVVERPDMFFKNGTTGTRIIMLGSPDPWTKADVTSTHNKLLRLVSPVAGPRDFHVRLLCPEYPEFEDLRPEGVLDNFHFQLIASVDSLGHASLHVENRLTGFVEDIDDVDLWKTVRRPYHDLNADTHTSCGAFDVELRAWRLVKPDLQKVGIRDRSVVDALAGVSVFRDGFRILPYGEYGNDWLELNKRRVNNPTERFSTNQIIGLVAIGTEANPELMDQANRLGLQYNPAFRDFHDLVVACVAELETRTLSKEAAKRAAEKRAEREREAAEREAAERHARLAELDPIVTDFMIEDDSEAPIARTLREKQQETFDVTGSPEGEQPPLAERLAARADVRSATLGKLVKELREMEVASPEDAVQLALNHAIEDLVQAMRALDAGLAA